MEHIKLHDKFFKPYIQNQVIELSVKKVAEQINEDYQNVDTPMVLVTLNGAFMFASGLLRHTDFKCEMAFIKVSSYAGTSTTGKVTEVIGLDRPVKGRHILIIEDIVDSGITMNNLKNKLIAEGAASVKIVCLFFKPGAFKFSDTLKIEYKAMDIGNEFIVGYGLDYDQLGRELQDIWVVDPDYDGFDGKWK